MTAKKYQYWVNRLAQYDPRSGTSGSPRSAVYREMIRAGVPIEDRVAIHKAACKLFEERKLKGREIASIWVDELSDPWGPTGRYGRSIPQQLTLDRAALNRLRREIIDRQFNTEGEKPMAEIDWKKPLRAFNTPGHEVVDAKVYTYKSGKQRVIWIDDRVYPVDEQGHAVADVNYGTHWTRKGVKIVENVPEEKFFVGLARDPDGTYWLADGGTVFDAYTMNYWKRSMADDPRPHWIVDTRKPAKPPAVNVHDPKDWTVVIGWDNSTTSYGMRTEADARAVAEQHAREGGDVKVVRVRTTPSPADTARYIQLWRMKESDPWLINKCYGNGRQEFTWDETKNRGVSPTRAAIKVRD